MKGEARKPSRHDKVVGFRMCRRALLWAIAEKREDDAYHHARKAFRMARAILGARERGEFQRPDRLMLLRRAYWRVRINREMDGLPIPGKK